jgi:hypothetical protein
MFGFILRSLFAPAIRARQGELQDLKAVLGKVLVELQKNRQPTSLRDSEFKVYSQFGEDGIIQNLLSRISSVPETFIEFGVQKYTEANTLFLLENDNWRGMIIDGSPENIASVKSRDAYWRHDLTAVSAFITRENINSIICSNGFRGELGLLSIDIDGNDYWVWEAISDVRPVIVVVEYNSLFGSTRAVTIPYDPMFRRETAHFSNLYWGASLKALSLLAERKGYCFVGCNQAGNNAFFVRTDKLGTVATCTVEEGFVRSKFRDSRDKTGQLAYLSGDAQQAVISHLEVLDLELNRKVFLREVFLAD